MSNIGAVRQVALSAGRDLDATLAFWHDVLGIPLHARYDPPGMAFLLAGEAEWMVFLKDPGGNTVGLVERKRAEA